MIEHRFHPAVPNYSFLSGGGFVTIQCDLEARDFHRLRFNHEVKAGFTDQHLDPTVMQLTLVMYAPRYEPHPSQTHSWTQNLSDYRRRYPSGSCAESF